MRFVEHSYSNEVGHNALVVGCLGEGMQKKQRFDSNLSERDHILIDG